MFEQYIDEQAKEVIAKLDNFEKFEVNARCMGWKICDGLVVRRVMTANYFVIEIHGLSIPDITPDKVLSILRNLITQMNFNKKQELRDIHAASDKLMGYHFD